jgi:hypothetical protein
VTLAVLAQIKVSRETVRLELKAAGYVWKRAKLKGRDDDPERARRLARIRLLIENQRPDELILFANARATILGGVCEHWSGTWKNIWRKTARGSTGCQRSTTLQKLIWKWMYCASELRLSS